MQRHMTGDIICYSERSEVSTLALIEFVWLPVLP